MPSNSNYVSTLVDRDGREGAVAATVAEEVPSGSMVTIPVRNDHRGERNLPAGQR